MLVNVADDRLRNEIPDTHLSSEKQTDFRAADIVLDKLRNYVDILLPWLQAGDSLINVRAAALNNKRLGIKVTNQYKDEPLRTQSRSR